MHPDHSGEGNKKITNKIKVELEDIEKATKTIAQHLSENRLTLETELPTLKKIQSMKKIKKFKRFQEIVIP